MASLCCYCSDLVKPQTDTLNLLIEPATSLSYHPSYGGVAASAESCAICRSILSHWVGFRAELTSRSAPDEISAERENAFRVDLTLHATKQTSSGVCWSLIEVALDATSVFPFESTSYITIESCSPLNRLPAWAGPSTTFEDKAAVMKSWLNDCCTQHGKDRCRPLDFVPLRLVQVGLDGATVQLVKGEAIGSLASVNYTTLSYCWGKTHQLQTTQDNVTEFSTEIPRELLPKTMREAIRMTHLLGIPYIWIDALCIVQDDREEWQNQAAQMHNIFRGSQLTIAAGQSSDSSKGCFPTRECLPGTGFVSNIEAADEVKARAGRLFRLYNGDVRNKAINSNILSTRGWTLQEQLLSTRIATYSEPHLLWHCHSCFATESGLVLDPDFIQSSAISFLYQDILQDERLRQFTWRQIVENYTLREFTHPSDRIPAIAGLIQYFSSLFQDNPVLGLWPKTFARDLGWMRLTEANDVSKVTGLPSWTWLASRGGVKYSFWPWNSAAEQQQVSHTNLLDYSV